jgi:hypothetical protein
LSTAINLCRSLVKIARSCGVNSRSLKKPGGPKIAPLVDRLKEAPGCLETYVKHLVKSIPNQVLAFMKSYFPKAPVDVVAGGLAASFTDEQYV